MTWEPGDLFLSHFNFVCYLLACFYAVQNFFLNIVIHASADLFLRRLTLNLTNHQRIIAPTLMQTMKTISRVLIVGTQQI